ncbi:MAG: TetR/AcrR family transcriptional regulator [Chloroflexota bacterium]|nr:TetR/AcrR family transcriptional regulator [Chloroflexota bacterium]MDE2637829.1 TetR/AcrR family transcriptional regulator [Chloroflexota bacterium]MYE27670.1 TetR/AcrR family transcriptional regulator [Chloroflexota bacterium]
MSEQGTDSRSTRERILDSAMNIFSAKGFHDTKLDEIVAEASISKGSIYFHFPNKERLFIALVDQFADVIERRAREAIDEEAPGIGRVQAALEAVMETFGKYRRPAKLLLVQAVGLGTVFERKRMEVTDRFALLIKTYLDEAVADGSIAPVNTHIVAHAWMGAIYSVVIQWVYTGEPSQEEIMDALLPLLLKSVGYQD